MTLNQHRVPELSVFTTIHPFGLKHKKADLAARFFNIVRLSRKLPKQFSYRSHALLPNPTHKHTTAIAAWRRLSEPLTTKSPRTVVPWTKPTMATSP